MCTFSPNPPLHPPYIHQLHWNYSIFPTSGASPSDSHGPVSAIHGSGTDLLTPVRPMVGLKRPRRAEHAEVLTSSPYKKMLKEALSSKKSAKKKPSSVPRKRLNTVQAGTEASTSRDETKCLVCGMLFRMSCEQWIQCSECSRWACVPCTDADDKQISYTCDFCRRWGVRYLEVRKAYLISG